MSDPDPDDLAEAVADELESGTVIADKVVISKAHAAAIMAGGATLAGVLGLSSGRASGQSGGQLGTSSSPIDAELGNYGSTSTANGYEIEIEGDVFTVNE